MRKCLHKTGLVLMRVVNVLIKNSKYRLQRIFVLRNNWNRIVSIVRYNYLRSLIVLVPFKRPVKFGYWKHGNHYCVLRSSNSFFDSPVHCENHPRYKGCGTSDNFICVNVNESCPISSMFIDEVNEGYGLTKVQMKGS